MPSNTAQAPSASSILRVVSPKQPPAIRLRDWYPYYAGFNEAFAAAVFDTHLRRPDSVLDPWSGSGTTTAIGLKLGIKSIGVDINPAATVIARARVTPMDSAASFMSLAPRILACAKSIAISANPQDPLTTWLQPAATVRIRAIQAATHELLTHSPAAEADLAEVADTLPSRVCFFYCSLFLAVRKILVRFRTSNPTWLKPPLSFRHRISPSWTTLTTSFLDSIRYLQERMSFIPGNYRFDPVPFITATATNLPFDTAAFDAVLTSPPYATRLDYVTSTLPELAILGATPSYLRKLRRTTTGSPVLRQLADRAEDSPVSDYAVHTLDYISSHRSKGSRSYYLPWMKQYLCDLQESLFEIDRAVRPGGVICMVVQDSYYKGLHINLQRIVRETLCCCGRVLTRSYDYPASNPRSHYNTPRETTVRPTRQHKETLLVFE